MHNSKCFLFFWRRNVECWTRLYGMRPGNLWCKVLLLYSGIVLSEISETKIITSYLVIISALFFVTLGRFEPGLRMCFRWISSVCPTYLLSHGPAWIKSGAKIPFPGSFCYSNPEFSVIYGFWRRWLHWNRSLFQLYYWSTAFSQQYTRAWRLVSVIKPVFEHFP